MEYSKEERNRNWTGVLIGSNNPSVIDRYNNTKNNMY